MKISKQARRDGKTLFRACLIDGRLDEARARRAVTLVLEGKPRGYLGTLRHFQGLLKLHLEARRARVENAIETPPELTDRIRHALATRYGPDLDLTFWVDPSLLGGLRIRVGSDVYDGTIKARLAALKESF